MSAANVQITAGCNQAFMSAAIALAGSGDTVALTQSILFQPETTLSMLGIKRALVECDAAERLPAGRSFRRDCPGRRRKGACCRDAEQSDRSDLSTDAASRAVRCFAANTARWLIVDETYRDFLPDGYGAPHPLLIDPRLGRHAHPALQLLEVVLYSRPSAWCDYRRRERRSPKIAKVMDNMQICAPRAAQVAVAEAMSNSRGLARG